MVIHTVKERESIREIAKEYGIDEGILRRNNGLEREEAAVGEELAIRIPTRTHRMSASDTPERIALRYSVRARELYANNPSLKSGGREGELIAVKYSPPEYGAAPANGYIYGGCDSERLERVMPYLTYVTIAAAVADGPAGDGGHCFTGCGSVFLKQFQNGLRSFQHGLRHTGQPGHMDTVAAVGGTGDDLAQEDHFIAVFPDCHIEVIHSASGLCQFGQFVIMGGKHGTAPGLIVEIFCDRPSQ